MSQSTTDEWKAKRMGWATASRISDIVAKGAGASRNNYRAQLVAERLTGVVLDGYKNGAMEWGIETEAEAANAYAFYSGISVEPVGFLVHPTIDMSGATPDRLVGLDGLLEIKCPNTATHIETLLGARIPTKYELQMQWQMACAGRAWCDFASYDPRLPEEMRLHVRRVPRDEIKICEIAKEVRAFLSEVDATVAELTKLYRQEAS